MRRIVLLIALLAAATAARAEPLHIKNHSPVWFGLLHPTPDAPAALAEGEGAVRAGLSYSSVFFHEKDQGWDYFFDMELAQLTLDLRRGLGGFEAGVELPLYYAGGGFLDQTILDYHQLFGFPDYIGQRTAPRNRYLYAVSHNGVEWRAPMPHAISLGDATLFIKRPLAEGETGALAIKLLLQAPTASTAGGFGNGAWEYGAMLIGQRRMGPLEVTLGGGAVNPGFIDRGERIALNIMYLVDGAAEYRLTGRLSAVAQLSVSTSPYGGGAPDMFRWAWRGLTLGGRYVTAAGRKMEFGFTEDVSMTAPDFTVHLGLAF